MVDSRKRPLHFGFAMFHSEDDAKMAVGNLDGLRFLGRDIRFSEFQNAASQEKGRQGAVHVFFRAQCVMSHDITEETLRKFLEQFGALEHIVIRMFETNALGLVEGFGFVTYVDWNTNLRVCKEVKHFVFEDVAYDCTLSKQLHTPNSIASHITVGKRNSTSFSSETTSGANLSTKSVPNPPPILIVPPIPYHSTPTTNMEMGIHHLWNSQLSAASQLTATAVAPSIHTQYDIAVPFENALPQTHPPLAYSLMLRSPFSIAHALHSDGKFYPVMGGVIYPMHNMNVQNQPFASWMNTFPPGMSYPVSSSPSMVSYNVHK
jgi:hypothetical protein